MSALAEQFCVPSDQLEAAWPEIARLVSRVTNLPWSLDDVFAELADKRAQCFGIRDRDEVIGIVITRIENTPSHRFGVIWIAAGVAHEAAFAMLRETIEPWMFEQGCEWVELQGRKGWQKLLPDYEFGSVVLRKYRNVH